MSKIYYGRFIGKCLIIDFHCIIISKLINHFHEKVARETLFPIFRKVSQF